MLPSTLILVLAAAIFGGYQIYYGISTFRRSGYHFYWISGLLIGVPFLLAAGWTASTPNTRYPLLELGVLLVWVLAELWRGWMKRRAIQRDPERWLRWQKEQTSEKSKS